eukprot:01866.XXX_5686_6054_1 [CDS] Oithona nana genome sequencing.
MIDAKLVILTFLWITFSFKGSFANDSTEQMPFNRIVQYGADSAPSSSSGSTGIVGKIKSAAKSVGRGLKVAAAGIWKFGKAAISKVPAIFSKIASFFGKRR